MKTSKLFLSLFVVFHLGLMVFIPLSPKFFKNHAPQIISDYTLITKINNSWGFFAPEPASEIYFKVKMFKGEKEINSLRWPESDLGFKLIETKKRRFFAARNIMRSKKKWRVLAKYFCKHHTDIDSLKLKLMSKPAVFPISYETPDEVFNEEAEFSCKGLWLDA